MAELIGSTGARFPIPLEAAVVGRNDADVDLGSLEGGRTVSKQHARIYRSGQDWYLQVQPTARNATVVAGQMLLPEQQTKLNDGDEIKLGNVTVTFRADPEPPVADANATVMRAGPAHAELRAGDVVRPLTVADGGTLRLGRRSDDNKYQPDVDLRDVPGGKTVSRRHGLLCRRGQTWYLWVETDAKNPTYLNTAPLRKAEEVALTDRDQLRLGSVLATFHQDKPVNYVDSDLIDVVLAPPTDVSLEAGAQQALILTVVNFTGRVDWFILDVSGIPSDWWRIVLPDGTSPPAGELPQIRLDTAAAPVPTASATGRATLILMPPRHARARAGTYPLLITATSLDNRRLRNTATGQLVVKPFSALRLTLEAPRQHGSRGSFRLGVFNDGNTPAVVSIGVDADKKLTPRLEQAELTLANGEETVVDLGLRLKRRPWLGPEVVHKATITAMAGEQTQMQEAFLTCPPLVPLWLQRLLGRINAGLRPILTMLAILAVLLVAGFLWLLPPDIKFGADAPLVASGGSTTLTWNVRRADGQAVLETPAGSQQVDLPSGTLTVNADQSAEYKLTAKNLIGLPATGTTKVQVLRVVSFTAAPEALKQPGDPVTLQWATENATSITIDPSDEIGAAPVNGKVVVHPQASTTYKLVAANERAKGQVSAEARATFGAPKITQFQPDHQQVFSGDPVVLSWVAEGFTKLTLKSGPDDLDLKGADQDVTRRTSIQVRPIRPAQYTLEAANSDGTTTEAQLSVGILPLKKPSLQPPAKPLSAGEHTTLTWQAEGANDRTKIVVQPGDMDVSGRTSLDVQPGETTQYTLLVTAADGQMVTSDPVTVAVLPSIQEFRVVPASIQEGDPVVLSWSVQGADTVTITRDDGARFVGKPVDEARDHPPASATSYTLKAHNATGDSVDSPTSVVKIKVDVPTPVPLPQIPQPANVQ